MSVLHRMIIQKHTSNFSPSSISCSAYKLFYQNYTFRNHHSLSSFLLHQLSISIFYNVPVNNFVRGTVLSSYTKYLAV